MSLLTISETFRRHLTTDCVPLGLAGRHCIHALLYRCCQKHFHHLDLKTFNIFSLQRIEFQIFANTPISGSELNPVTLFSIISRDWHCIFQAVNIIEAERDKYLEGKWISHKILDSTSYFIHTLSF